MKPLWHADMYSICSNEIPKFLTCIQNPALLGERDQGPQLGCASFSQLRNKLRRSYGLDSLGV